MKNTALITGSSGGIGYELAGIHASKGGDLILVARNRDKLVKLKTDLEKNYHINVHIIIKDLSVPGAAREVFDEVKIHRIVVEYLVNNAGFGDSGFFAESDWPKQEQMINLNIMSLAHLTWLFLPDMISRNRGKIMNVASTAAFIPGPTMAVYYATKAFVLSFSQAIDNEVRDHGITVTSLCPGPTRSGFRDTASPEDSWIPEKDKTPGAREVAEYGYYSMMSGKTVAIHGFTNKILAHSARIIPRVAAKAVRKIHEKRY
jgi:short-subunit dehydrogenase